MKVFEAIDKTIKYSQKYGGKLTDKQLFERLIGNQIYTKEEINKIVEQTLRPDICRDTSSTYGDLRLDREALIKIKKAENLAKLLNKKFKTILFLGITGSVAAGYPKKNDDIDLIIITKINKLWMTRLKLRWFITINKIPHRRFGKKEKKDDFCFNLWLDEKSLKLNDKKQNLKNAMDLILMEPLINKNKTYEKFIFNNDWAKNFVATGYNLKPTLPSIEDGGFKKNIFFDGVINWLVFWPQFLYMKKRIKNEKVGLHEAFFHH